jgi:hypothetical protein
VPRNRFGCYREEKTARSIMSDYITNVTFDSFETFSYKLRPFILPTLVGSSVCVDLRAGCRFF